MTTAAANRKYFDSISSSYDSKPWFATVNAQVTTTLRSDLSWLGIPLATPELTSTSDSATQNAYPTTDSPVRLLDYACGTGLMTRVLGPYVTFTQGIDISPNMISTYTSRVRDAGIPESVVSGVVGDLFDKGDPSPAHLAGEQYFNFDIAAVGFGFHHFEDVVFAAAQLRQRLRPGGVLVINDFLEGGDMKADEEGREIEGSAGNWAVHEHGQGHSHGHGHKHEHEHHHHHGHEHKHEHKHTNDDDKEQQHSLDDTSPAFREKMNNSIVVPHFTIAGVKKFFAEAGFVDVDVITMKERCYMEFAGKKLWRTILFARGRRPFEDEKSEL